jgi:hypothetical protein
MEARIVRGLAAAALGLVCACGGETAPKAQASMVPAKKARDAARAGDNHAPVVERVRFEPRTPVAGEALTAHAQASDADGDSLRLTYRWFVNGRPVAGRGETLPAGSVGRDQRVEVEVVANDGLEDSEPMRARASADALAPTIRAVYFDPSEGVKPGTEVAALVDAGAADDASLRLEYAWLVNGDETRQRGRTFDTTGLHRGDRVQARVVARDGEAASDPFLSPELVLANSPPVLAGIPKPERDGDAFRYQFEASDPDGDRSLRYALTEAPSGMTIDPIYGVATWRPGEAQAGAHTIEVAVTDNHGDGSKLRFEVTVTATTTNAPAPGQAAAAAQPPAAPAEAP